MLPPATRSMTSAARGGHQVLSTSAPGSNSFPVLGVGRGVPFRDNADYGDGKGAAPQRLQAPIFPRDFGGSPSALPLLENGISPRGAPPPRGRLEASRAEGFSQNRLGGENLEYRPLEVGLDNLGNTCFMNASLQCLLHIPQLVSFFLRPDCDEQANPDSPFKGALARSFTQLCRDMFSTKKSSYSPTSFQRNVAALAPQLLDYQQQDCHEFLRFLLDGLSEDLCRRPKELPAPVTAPPAAAAAVGAGAGAGATVAATASAPTQQPSSSGASPAKQHRALSLSSGAKAASEDQLVDAMSSLALSSANKAVPASTSSSAPWDGDNQGSEVDGSQTEGGSSDAAANGARSRRRIVQRGNSPIPFAENQIGTAAEALQQPAAATATATAPAPAPTVVDPTAEAAKAWHSYLRKNDSVITDLFAGQMQSVIECQTCHHRSMCFDPFLDLSLPLPKAAEAAAPVGGRLSFRRVQGASADTKCTLEECLSKFTAEEVLDGEEMVSCDVCKAKRRGVKRLSLYRMPAVLVVQIKRFRFSTVARDKIMTDVTFPVQGLDLASFASQDRLPPGAGGAPGAQATMGVSDCNPGGTLYDLVGVSSHSGSMHGGHYIAHVDVNAGLAGAGGGGASRWVCFNDGRASTAQGAPTGPSAYVLFYRRRGK